MNEYLFRRVPDFDKELAKDRYPFAYTYAGLYPTESWPSFTGTEHTWDKLHVTRPDDDGCWDQMDASTSSGGHCAVQAMCDPQRVTLGWGSTRSTYVKYHRDYTTPPFCYDRLRHIEEAVAQVGAIIDGLKELPDQIISDFIRLLSLRQSDYIYVCGSALTRVATTASMFTGNCTILDLGSASYIPTSKLTMQYLEHYAPQLMYQGYFRKEFIPDGKFLLMGDISTFQELGAANPALSNMYNAADFSKGGKFFQYGAMMGCGNYLFKVDATPLRFASLGSGKFKRLWPYQNTAATIGKKPVFDPEYENAAYQLYHVYNRQARTVYTGSMESVNPDMPFMKRGLMGKWSWKSPDAFQSRDPNTGTVCTIYNDKKNKGYFLGEYEMGSKTTNPEVEFWIIALRESQPVADVPRAASITWPTSLSGGQYQTLTPYNSFCDES
jgi:hypothetical protein